MSRTRARPLTVCTRFERMLPLTTTQLACGQQAMPTAMDEKAALTCRFVSFADAG